MTPPCYIIGVLDDGIASLTPSALKRIQQADLIIGGHRTLALFSEQFKSTAEQRDLTGCMTTLPEWIQAAQAEGKQCVVLATGDPLCHGIGSYLISKLGRNACQIRPNCSTLQLAFARLGMAWQDAKICSVHSKDTGEWTPEAGPEHGLYPLLQQILRHSKLAILTSPENTPDRIARMLVSEGVADQFRMAVVEQINQPNEAIKADLVITDATNMSFADPNVVILLRDQPAAQPVLFGLADNSFIQRKPEKGLITKREVRAVSLALMQLRRDSIIWDIGAGSGSVGLEAARLCPEGHVYAVEKNEGDAENARANRQQLDIHNYTLIHAKAPDGLESWPDPDAIFVGGSGGELTLLIELAMQRLKENGQLVMNFVTFENLNTAIETLKKVEANWEITQLQAARSKPVLDMFRLAAENPVWVVSASRKDE